MKYNKKGFTLVELIVVIAIMAVLAGVVSGATVGILNKKTDEVNYIYNGKQISAQIVSWAQEVVERPSFFTELTGIEIDVTDLLWTDAYSEAAYNTLKNRFSSLKWADSYGVPEKKGTFSADFNTEQKAIYLYYKGKSQEYREVYYKIYLSGENVVTEKGTGF
jgi:prepilin-type cleavage/methylation N-terminal domain protein